MKANGASPAASSQSLSPPTGLLRTALLTAAITLTVYAPTVARDLTWANAATDGGDLITASYTLGIPHPPGYPTYVLLGKLFSFVPLGTVAFRYNLFSAVCAAMAAGLLAATIRAQWGARVSPPMAVAAALSFAFLPLVWSQAVVAEVYSLNLLLVAAFLLLAARGRAWGSGLLLGLALTAHPTSLLLLPAALLGAGRAWSRLLMGTVAGLLPLLLLPWLARGDSPVVWGRPETLGGWWWLVSGRLYAANLQLPPDGTRLALLARAVALGVAAFGPAALILGRPPAAGQLTALAPPATGSVRPVLLLGATGVAYVLFALVYVTPDAAVLLLPALLIAALLAAPGLARLGRLAVALPLLLAVAGLLTHAGGAAEPTPRALAEAALSAAPPNAVLLTPGDRSLFTLWYFHHVEGLRPDVVVADANLLAFDWYRRRLAAQEMGLFVPAADDLIAFQRDNAVARPFCAVSLMATPLTLPAGERTTAPPANPPTLLCTGKR